MFNIVAKMYRKHILGEISSLCMLNNITAAGSIYSQMVNTNHITFRCEIFIKNLFWMTFDIIIMPNSSPSKITELRNFDISNLVKFHYCTTILKRTKYRGKKSKTDTPTYYDAGWYEKFSSHWQGIIKYQSWKNFSTGNIFTVKKKKRKKRSKYSK